MERGSWGSCFPLVTLGSDAARTSIPRCSIHRLDLPTTFVRKFPAIRHFSISCCKIQMGSLEISYYPWKWRHKHRIPQEAPSSLRGNQHQEQVYILQSPGLGQCRATKGNWRFFHVHLTPCPITSKAPYRVLSPFLEKVQSSWKSVKTSVGGTNCCSLVTFHLFSVGTLHFVWGALVMWTATGYVASTRDDHATTLKATHTCLDHSQSLIS